MNERLGEPDAEVGVLQLVLATANPDKASEIVDILGGGGGVELLSRPTDVPEVDETGVTLEANARLKAETLCRATGKAAVADDTGLEVDGLGGQPGVHSSRYAGEAASYDDNIRALLGALASVPGVDRHARFCTVAVVRFPDGREVVAEGVIEGSIGLVPRGEAGFGYDPVFVPEEGDGRTFAEMRPEEKHELSHRGRAFRALARELARQTRA